MHRIGIDLGGSKIEGIVLASDGEIIDKIRIATPKDSYSQTLIAITELVRHLEKDGSRLCSVGIGTPGAISSKTGAIKNANSTCLNGQTLQQDLEHKLKREIRIANDANCFALSEANDGAGKNYQNIFGVIIGTGTGGGIVINKHLLTGANTIAGEWGHNPIPWPDDNERHSHPCYCGKQSCIETFLSGPGLEKDFDPKRTLTAQQITEEAKQGNTNAEACLKRYERRMAKSLASVINVIDPDAIILGGGLSKIERLYENVPRLWQEYVFSDQVQTQLLPPVHGDASGVRGAAWLWPND